MLFHGTEMYGRVLFLLGCAWLIGSFGLALVFSDVPVVRMAFGLLMVWVAFCGGSFYYFKDVVRAKLARYSVRPRIAFVCVAILCALVEESIAVAMTNLAPLFGGRVGESYITASTNYVDVVLFHSVVMFIPFFIGLSYVYYRYALSPVGAFWLFGILGLLLEVVYGGVSAFSIAIFWIFVYGLMAYVPAYVYAVPDRSAVLHLRRYGVAFGVMVAIAIPQALVLFYFINHVLGHPAIHV